MNARASATPGARRRSRPRNQVQRHRERAAYDRAAAYAILDAGFIAHVGFVVDDQPFVIPMLYARDGDRVILHGGISSRIHRTLETGLECCVTVTLLDGLVLARSLFSHSMNYRSVVVFGSTKEVTEPAEKTRCLTRLIDMLVPGRAGDARAGDAQELAATGVLALEIADLSVKTRSGGPNDLDVDRDLPVWSGVVPLTLERGQPVPADDLVAGVTLPAYLESAPG
jgi:nitroimidazol reductase NimA-like FMN-containing flavoprotein (pyridoxamine 5'-phosphate oxidase superfamily)